MRYFLLAIALMITASCFGQSSANNAAQEVYCAINKKYDICLCFRKGYQEVTMSWVPREVCTQSEGKD